MIRNRNRALGALVLTVVTGCGSSSSPRAVTSDGTALSGTFRLAPGHCGASGATGTYFRMITPGGTIAAGKFFANPDSTCTDKTYTLAKPGSSGGFTTGRYQPNPTPAFTATGSARAASIVAPQSFTAIDFAISTNAVDPQTRRNVPPPSIVDRGGVLSGQLEAWSAAWNNQYFNQGSPKPDGTRPGLTTPVSGTYDASTHSFVLTWASQVVGGPFNGFTGYWHLTGTFVAGT